MPQGKWIVALDGPAGAGKSTVSKLLAQRLGFALVDTGAIYRCIALKAARAGLSSAPDDALGDLVSRVRVGFEFKGDINRVTMDGDDVTEAIRTPANSRAASDVSARPVVRQGLLALQRRLALDAPQPGAVLEGRDIGTVVFPDAEVKVFMDASVEERARRRHQELLAKGGATPSLDEVKADIVARDAQDSGRSAAPLKRADDARLLDSTTLTVEQMVDTLARWVEDVRAQR